MPTWDEILKEIGSTDNIIDATRKKYIKKLSEHTGRNTIVYYSGFLQKPMLSRQGVDFGINDEDKNGFMTIVKNLDRKAGVDLILHTPGGNVASTETIVNYLYSIFGKDIRAIIPQIAMSAGTMMACACKSIVMGKQSNLGPIDPQFTDPLYGTIPAQGIIEEFDNIMQQAKSNPQSILVWREILGKYKPTLIGECKKAVKWAETMVSEWLKENMFANEPNKDRTVTTILNYLGSHDNTLSHNRHIHIDALKAIGLKVEDMESDQEFQDLVLSIHHSTIISITQTKAFKVIENNLGKAYIRLA